MTCDSCVITPLLITCLPSAEWVMGRAREQWLLNGSNYAALQRQRDLFSACTDKDAYRWVQED